MNIYIVKITYPIDGEYVKKTVVVDSLNAVTKLKMLVEKRCKQYDFIFKEECHHVYRETEIDLEKLVAINTDYAQNEPVMNRKTCSDCLYCSSVLSGDYKWCNINGQDEPIEGWDNACSKFVEDTRYIFNLKKQNKSNI